MSGVRLSLAALLVLAGCGGSPFPSGGSGGTSVFGKTDPTTGTRPSPSGSIARHERQNTGPDGTKMTGNGYAFKDGKINYNATDDTFTVHNLAFDGDNVYDRVDVAGAFPDPDTGADIGPARVYAGKGVVRDNQTGAQIDQFSYRALYGESASGHTHFAIVRTGAYAGFGFGGFIYGRTGGMTFPANTGSDKQAYYSGSYAGLRDSDQGGLQYTKGDMDLTIDLDGFDQENPKTGNTAAIYGSIINRRIYDDQGNDITDGVLQAINHDKGSNEGVLPMLQLSVSTGSVDNNGEALGGVNSLITDQKGAHVQLEAGKYYAVLSGTNTTEIAGVVAVTSTINGTVFRETGGFILYRP